jgi:uncharacterized protein YdaU (DUF1376 family)
LPDDDAQLARIVGVSPAKWRKLKPVLKGLFQDDCWRHKRMDEQLVYAADRKQRARKAANTRWKEAA